MRRTNKYLSFTAVLAASFIYICPAVFAAALTPLNIAENIQRQYEKAITMVADFSQVTSVPMSRRKREGAGTIKISKPGKIRWDYTKPDEQVLVSNGTKVFMYFAQSEQMIVQTLAEYLSSDVTYSFFVGSGNILEDFTVHPAERPAIGKGHVVKLIPKEEHPQVDFLHIWVEKDSFTLTRLEIVDHFGSVTDLRFRNMEINSVVPASVFVFTPPPGTEILEQ